MRHWGYPPACWQTEHVAGRLPPSDWCFPSDESSQAQAAAGGEVVGTGADLEPSTLVAAYSCGLFPMPVGSRLAWWSPDPRGILPLEGLRATRSLRQSCRRFEIRLDTAFGAVIDACADPSRAGAWIDRQVGAAYRRLHELGFAHSVEAWTPAGELAGGLYGVAVGGLFAGESMFHRERDASKVALVALVEMLRAGGGILLDVQWSTPHLASLGVVEVSRRQYLELLKDAVKAPQLVLGL